MTAFLLIDEARTAVPTGTARQVAFAQSAGPRQFAHVGMALSRRQPDPATPEMTEEK